MSAIHWHTPDRTADLQGSERAHMHLLVETHAATAWDIRDAGRAAEILDMVPASADDTVHELRRLADMRPRDFDSSARLKMWLRTALRAESLPLHVAGVDLRSGAVEANTALLAGSDLVRLAAKIARWCEVHCWFDGPDRAWVADLIDHGLTAGLYRRGLWYVDRPVDGGVTERTPDARWLTQGWERVLDLLRERDDQPVVLSYSVTDGFPNPPLAGIHGVDAADAATADAAWDEWDALDPAEQWDRAMAGLRAAQPWAQITPANLATTTFGAPVTIYDLFAPDRDARVRAAAADLEDTP